MMGVHGLGLAAAVGLFLRVFRCSGMELIAENQTFARVCS
jgi:hypothetical protein